MTSPRICAVSGGTYILGRELDSISRIEKDENGPLYRVSLKGLDESIDGKLIIASPEYLAEIDSLDIATQKDTMSEEEAAYCIAIVEGPLVSPSHAEANQEISSHENENSERPLDTALLVFPPGSLVTGGCKGSVNVLVNGEGTLSCPREQCESHILCASQSNNMFSGILYLCSNCGESESPEQLLRPYLDATLSLFRTTHGSSPIIRYSTFYKSTTRRCTDERSAYWKERNVLLSRSLPSCLALNGDAAAIDAERLFREVKGAFNSLDSSDSMWPPLPLDQDDED